MHGSQIYSDVGCIANSAEKISSFTLELHNLDKISVALPLNAIIVLICQRKILLNLCLMMLIIRHKYYYDDQMMMANEG